MAARNYRIIYGERSDIMKITEMNNCIEEMRKCYKFEDDKTEIRLGNIPTVIANEVQRQVKEAKAEWLKSRPAINAGGGEESTITQEQFNKMNYHERVEFKNKNPELYKKFTE